MPICRHCLTNWFGDELWNFEIVNADKLTNVLLNEAAVQYINDAAKGVLMLNVPAELDGTYSLKLISSNGEIAYDVLVVANEETVWAGPLDISWGDGGRVLVPAVSFAKVTGRHCHESLF